jgi:hypothetical protein
MKEKRISRNSTTEGLKRKLRNRRMSSSTCKILIQYFDKRAPLRKLLTIGSKTRAMKIYVFIEITATSQFSTEGDRVMKEKPREDPSRAFFYNSIGVMDEFFGEPSSINHR